MNLIPLLLGWPSLILALILAVTGVAKEKSYLIWIGLVLNLPMALYIFGSPLYWYAAAAPIVGLSLAALSVHNKWRWPALLGVGLYSAYVFALATLVFAFQGN